MRYSGKHHPNQVELTGGESIQIGKHFQIQMDAISHIRLSDSH